MITMRRYSFILFALIHILFVGHFAIAEGNDANQWKQWKQWKQSIVRLGVVYNDQKTGTGTGFYVGDTCEIVTAYHVVSNAKLIRISKYDPIIDGWAFKGVTVDPDDLVVSGYSPLHDLARFFVRDAADCNPLSVVEPNIIIDVPTSVQIITPIMQAGRQEMTLQTHGRKISSLSDLHRENIFSDEVLGLKIDSLIGPLLNGMSGSPVIFEGKVLGVVSGSRDQGNDYVWSIPIDYLGELEDVGKSLDKIEDWTPLALLTDNASTKLRVSTRQVSTKSPKIIFTPISYGNNVRIEFRAGEVPLEQIQIGPRKISEPIYRAVKVDLPVVENQINHFEFSISAAETIQHGAIHVLSVDEDLLGGRLDQWRSESARAAAQQADYPTAIDFIDDIIEPRNLSKARANLCWSLIKHGRKLDCLEFLEELRPNEFTDNVVEYLVGWVLYQREWPNRLDLASEIANLAVETQTKDELVGRIAEETVQQENSHDSELGEQLSQSVFQEESFSGTKLAMAEEHFYNGDFLRSFETVLKSFPSERLAIENKIDLLIRLTHRLSKSQRSEQAERAAMAAYDTVFATYAEYSPERLHYFLRLASIAVRFDIEPTMAKIQTEFDRYVMRNRPTTEQAEEEYERAIISISLFWAKIGDPNRSIQLARLLEIPKHRLFGLTVGGMAALRSPTPNAVRKFVEAIVAERNIFEPDSRAFRIGNIHAITAEFETAGDWRPAWFMIWFSPELYNHEIRKFYFSGGFSHTAFETALVSLAVEQMVLDDTEGAKETLAHIPTEISSAAFTSAVVRAIQRNVDNQITYRDAKRIIEIIRLGPNPERRLLDLIHLRNDLNGAHADLVEKALSNESRLVLVRAKKDSSLERDQVGAVIGALKIRQDSEFLRAVLERFKPNLDPNYLDENWFDINVAHIIGSFASYLELCSLSQYSDVCTDEHFEALLKIARDKRVRRFFGGFAIKVAADYLLEHERIEELANVAMLDPGTEGFLVIKEISDSFLRQHRLTELAVLRTHIAAHMESTGHSDGKILTDLIDMRLVTDPSFLDREGRLAVTKELMQSQAKDMRLIQLAATAETFKEAVHLTSLVVQADILESEIEEALQANAILNQDGAFEFLSEQAPKDDELAFIVLSGMREFVNQLNDPVVSLFAK